MSCGIYKITNKINNKCYIGLSKNIEARWKQHQTRYLDIGDKEYDKALYRAFRKYEINNFIWEIIEECSEQSLSEKEIYWISYYDSFSNGYNETPGGAIGNICQGEQHPNHKLTEQDVIIIRTYYKNLARKRDIYQLYKDRIGESGFGKIWKGETWTNIMMDIYTPERKQYHKMHTGNSGITNSRALITERDVYNIRLRKKNGEKCSDVSKDYPMLTKGGFYSIWSEHTWKNIVV